MDPRPFHVGKTFRLFKAENELLRKTIRFLLQSDNIGGFSTVFDTSNPLKKFVLCNDSSVVCQLGDVNVRFLQ